LLNHPLLRIIAQTNVNVSYPCPMPHIKSQIFSALLWTASLSGLTYPLAPQPAIAQQWQPVSTLQKNSVAPSATPSNAITFRQSQSGVCPTELAGRIEEIIGSPSYRGAQWGILVASASTNTPLYSWHADDWLIPASNTKLLTTAAALQSFNYSDPSSFNNLRAWLTEVNRFSDNDYADSLLRRMGGAGAVRTTLAHLGIDPTGFRQVDGSGLSRSNRVKPRTLVSILQTMQTTDTTGLFYDSLSVAGVSGTLRNRFHNTPVEGRLRAKTGTLNGVRALSGYLDTSDYGPIVLSILVNQPGQYGDTLVRGIDRIVVQLSRLTTCN
jgi:serine-type D-Ala-D-Ala carboxypeptidase/endopeptidase (penicillin-binding protein 4)